MLKKIKKIIDIGGVICGVGVAIGFFMNNWKIALSSAILMNGFQLYSLSLNQKIGSLDSALSGVLEGLIPKK